MGHGSDARGTRAACHAPHSDREGKGRGFREKRTQLQLAIAGVIRVQAVSNPLLFNTKPDLPISATDEEMRVKYGISNCI